MEAAAKQLTPVTLELGGKSPTIIDDSADLSSAALKICWGKFINAGQTCVAPDYVFVPEHRLKECLEQFKLAIGSLYGDTEEARQQSPDFCRIINQKHYNRLKKLLLETTGLGSKLEIGGKFNDATLYLSPTVLSQVQLDSPIMQTEIFGPLLPILTYRSLSEVYRFIRLQPKPLALYIFSKNRKMIASTLQETTAGGTCVNHTLLHLTNPHLPFGGIGPSGIGSYHGIHGFKTFSHARAVFKQGPFDVSKLLFPPFRKIHQWIIDFSMGHRSPRS
jgi:aldehyde dehydrogenase (NAD+)